MEDKLVTLQGHLHCNQSQETVYEGTLATSSDADQVNQNLF